MFQRGKRARASASALVEHDDPVAIGVEKPANGGRCPAAWPAVQRDNGNSIGSPAFFIVKGVPVTDGQHSGAEWLDMRVETNAMVAASLGVHRQTCANDAVKRLVFDQLMRFDREIKRRGGRR